MNEYRFSFCGAALWALPSGALFWPEQALLCVSDMHLGKSERIARRGGAMLPPYEVRETLSRLEEDINATDARVVVCLGDSFDDLAAADHLPEDEILWLNRLMAGRRWIWIEGNHDAGPTELGGTHLGQLTCGPLIFRHIAEPAPQGEVSGHYHPKARIGPVTRPCFLIDSNRIVMPSYGAYTGGLRSSDPVLVDLMGPKALAILTGTPPRPIPMPRKRKP